MSTTAKLREEASNIWERIRAHPFVVELYSGTLPLEKFKYYLLQDFNYLVGFTKAFAAAVLKAPDLGGMKLALELAHGEVTGELANYEALLAELGLGLGDAASARPNPTNVAYMNFLTSTCLLGSFAQCLAALLPCFWTYLEIAEVHRERLERNNVAVYKKWASLYLSPEYRSLVDRLRIALDQSGASLGELEGPFTAASLYELMFWEAAYRREQWPA